MKINILATNNYKTTFEDISKDASIDSIKVELFRQHSDYLPSPSTLFSDDDDYITETNVNSNNKNVTSSSSSSMDIDKNNNNVNRVKQQYNSTLVHPYQIKILFGGKQLENYSTIAENNIQDGNTLLVAVSPVFLDVLQSDQEKIKQLNDNQSNSEKLFSAFSRTGTLDWDVVRDESANPEEAPSVVSYVLSLNDQANDTVGSTFNNNVLTPLTDVEVSDLLVRLPSLEDDKELETANNNALNNQLYKTKDKPPKIASPSKKGEPKPEQDLVLQLDKISLESQVKRPEVRFSPIDVLTATPNGTNVTVARVQFVFSRPFIPLFDDFSKMTVPLVITPPVPDAKWKWLDGVTCVYEKKDYTPFPGSTHYSIVFDQEQYPDVEFSKSMVDKVWTFSTVSQMATRVAFNGKLDSPQISVQFTQPVHPSQDLNKFITVKDKKNGKKFKIEVIGSDHPDLCSTFKSKDNDLPDVGIQPKDKSEQKIIYIKINGGSLSLQTTYTVTFKAGLRSTDGPLLTLSKSNLIFTTPNVFAATIDKNALPSVNSISIQLTRPFKAIDKIRLTPEELDSKIHFEPKVEISAIRCHFNAMVIEANFSPLTNYRVVLNNIESNDGATLQRTVLDFKTPEEKPEVAFKPSLNYSSFNLDPLSQPMVTIVTKGVSKVVLEAYKIKPSDFKEYNSFNPYTHNSTFGVRSTVQELAPIWIKCFKSKTISIEREGNKRTETVVDLTEFYGADTPTLVTDPLLFFTLTNEAKTVRSVKVLQYTPLSIAIQPSTTEVVVQVTNVLTKEEPTTLLVDVYNQSDRLSHSLLGSQGVVKIPRTSIIQTMVATTTNRDKTTHSCVLYNHISVGETGHTLSWNTINDLGSYRPTDTVNVKGLIRLYDEDGIQTPLQFYGDNSLSFIKYTLIDTRRKEYFKDSTTNVNYLGSFHITFKLPEDINLGDCKLKMSCLSGKYNHELSINVLECKRKEFEVDFDVKYRKQEAKTNIYNGRTKIVNGVDAFFVEAFGRAFTSEILANTMVNWKVDVSECNPFVGPSGYSVQTAPSSKLGVNPNTYEYVSRRNPSGRHQLRLAFSQMNRCLNVNVRGEMLDITNKSESFSQNFMVLDDSLYLLCSSPKKIYNSDEEVSIKAMVYSAAGKQVQDGKIHVVAKMMPWASRDDEVIPPKTIVDTVLQAHEDVPSIFNYRFEERGHYSLHLHHVSDVGIHSCTQNYSFFVFGEQTLAEREYLETTPKVTTEEQRQRLLSKPPANISLTIEGSEKYEIGDTLDIMIRSNLRHGRGRLFTQKLDNISSITPFNLVDGVFKTSLKITENHFPFIKISCVVQGFTSFEYLGKTQERFTDGFAERTIVISRRTKQLSVTFEPYSKLQTPKESSKIDVVVRDHLGKPVQDAEVTLIVADESLLQLSKRTVAHWTPMNFYPSRIQDWANSISLTDLTLYSLPTEEKKVAASSSSLLNITIRYFSGRIIILEKLQANTSIEEIRKLVQERDGLPPSSQRLFYLNKQIENGTLESNGITSNVTMNLVIRLFGGSDVNPKDEFDNLPQVKQIKVRDNFCPRATFETNVFTNAQGIASFKFTLPDNLTKYRVMALALTKDQFGSGEDFFSSSLPVMIRQSPPRFLHYMDESTFPIIVQNIIDYDVQVQIAFRSNNCLLANKGYKSIIPANSRLIVPCSVKSVVPNTSSSFQAVLSSRIDSNGIKAEFTDAVKFTFPVYSATSLESTVISHILTKDKEVAQYPLNIPNFAQLDQESGGLTIQMSSNSLSKIIPAIDYLLQYEHSCTEQLCSKMLSLFVIGKAPQLFEGNQSIPSPDKVQVLLKEMMDLLEKRLKDSGAFSYWNGPKAYDFVNIYAYWVLSSLKSMGVTVPTKLTSKLSTYIKSLMVIDESEMKKEGLSYLVCKAFATYVAFKNSQNVASFANQLYTKGIKAFPEPSQYMSFFVFLMPILTTCKTTKEIENHIKITASLAYLDSIDVDRFYSETRSTAFLILAMIEINPDYHLIPKLVSGLDSMRRDRGGWYNTQDNAYSLFAIYKYCQSSKLLESKIKTKVFINDKCPEPTPTEINAQTNYRRFIPMKTLIKNQGNVIFEKKGKGPLFHTLSFQYGPSNPIYNPVSDRGLVIERKFIPLGKKDDVEYEPQNSIVIKSGSKVRVQLSIHAHQLSSFVVVSDKLPAGLEPTNDAPYRQYWYDHAQVRDKGAEIFIDTLYPGRYTFSYICSAISLGTYICPPTKIEEMYTPSTFGRTESQYVKII